MSWYIYIYIYSLYIYIFKQQFFLVLESDWLVRVRYYSDIRTPTAVSQFVIISHIAVLLIVSVMADTQIQYHFTAFVSRNVVSRGFQARMYLFIVQICSLLIKIMSIWKFWCFRTCELQMVSSRSAFMKLPESTSPRPDLLEFTAGSDVSIVVTREI